MASTPMDLGGWINSTLVLPATIALIFLLGEHLLATLVPPSRWSARWGLALGVHWFWPLLLLMWTVQRYPGAVDALHLVPPESPLHVLRAAGAVFVLVVVLGLMWWWIAPTLRGSAVLFAPESLPFPWRPLVLAAEALAHQTTFALLRLPITSEAAAWGICLLIGVLLAAGVWLSARGNSQPLPRSLPLLLLGFIVGTGFVLSGYSLWAAFVWEWGFLLAVSAGQ